uniref:ABC transmembrane type-1 domain-containing protein n=1 Tax=Timema bartmani TaxID=61472 RepID=A0A7R9FBQ5_9NEOP|nr:unnamed protein product [Timema bartmani]
MEAYNKQDKTHFRKPTPFISDLFFGYTIPIFKKGYNGDLEESDLLGPVKKDQSNIVGDAIEATWFEELELSRQRNRNPSLLKVVFRAFYWDFLILGALQMVCDMVLRMSQPLVLGHLLSYFKPGSGVTKQEAYISSAVLALIVGLTAIMYNHIVMRSFNLGMRVRVALSSLIYRKLKYSLSKEETWDVEPWLVVWREDLNG